MRCTISAATAHLTAGKRSDRMAWWYFMCFNLWPLLLILSLGTTKKSLALSSWLSSRYLYVLARSHLSLLFSRLNRPSSCSLSSWEMLQTSSHLWVPHWTSSSSSLSFLIFGAQNWAQYSRHTSPGPRSLTKKFNKTGPSIDSWCSPASNWILLRWSWCSELCHSVSSWSALIPCPFL